MPVDQLDQPVEVQAGDQPPPLAEPVALVTEPVRPDVDVSLGAPAAPDAELARILCLCVPVIAQLARRLMPVAAVRDFSVGMLIEFDKPVDEPLDLLVNNHAVGKGICVKAGENFGVRITEICDRQQRVLSLA